MLIGCALSAVFPIPVPRLAYAGCSRYLRSGKIPASRQLMPLAFAAGLGASSLWSARRLTLSRWRLSAAGFKPFSFFEFAWIGIPLSFAGIL
jgi:di/tricarboxylate transporter